MVIVKNPAIEELTSGIPNNDFFVIHNDNNQEMTLNECVTVFEDHFYPDVDMIIFPKNASFSLSDFLEKNKDSIDQELQEHEDAGCLICQYELTDYDLIYFSTDLDLNYPIVEIFKEYLNQLNIEIFKDIRIAHFNLKEEYFTEEKNNSYFSLYLDNDSESINLMTELFNYQ